MKRQIRLIQGKFDAAEGYSIIKLLIQKKVQHHALKSLSYMEQGLDTSESDRKLEYFKRVIDEINHEIETLPDGAVLDIDCKITYTVKDAN